MQLRKKAPMNKLNICFYKATVKLAKIVASLLTRIFLRMTLKLWPVWLSCLEC